MTSSGEEKGFGWSARWRRLVGVVAGLAVLATVLTAVGAPASASEPAPPFGFALDATAAGDTRTAVAVDGSGNSFITGSFRGFGRFGTTTLTGEGLDDVFVARLDSAGSVTWAKRFGGTSFDVGRAIAVDESGNVYVAGYFAESVTFGSTTLISEGLSDGFVAKLDSNGSVIWAQNVSGPSADHVTGLAVDGSGNIYITGGFRVSATFGATTLLSGGVNDVFVAKLDSAGSWLWAERMGGNGDDFGQGVAVDSSNNIYVSGYFEKSATFGSTTLVAPPPPRTSIPRRDAFVVRLDSAGTVIWATRMGADGADQANAVAVDGAGGIYITGHFGGPNLTWFDAFVARLDSAGSVVWTEIPSGTGMSFGLGVAVDDFGNVYSAGYFWEQVTFGATSLVAEPRKYDMFVVKLDSAGSVVWAKDAAGGRHVRAHALAVTDSGDVYVIGRLDLRVIFTGPAFFGDAALTRSVFVAKLNAGVEVCDGSVVTIDMNLNGGSGIGTVGDDVILGTAVADRINGLGGDDTICAGAGPDLVLGGPGDDTIFGEVGGDTIRGGGGADTIDGAEGPDTILGQGGSDVLLGGAGPDVIDGQGAADTIDGGASNDTISGHNGVDVITGGPGVDNIKGQTGADVLHGDAGDDTLVGGLGDDTLYGGAGFDRCSGNFGANDQAEAATCEQTPGVEVLF